MELRHLRYFVAVAEERNFTRAAERVGIKQPPLSTQIRQLEKEIGTPLFRRLTRGVELTGGGKLLLEEARNILEHVERAKTDVKRRARGETGQIWIGSAAATYFEPLVIRIMREYQRKYPNIVLYSEESSTSLLVARVHAGKVDAAFVWSPIADHDHLIIVPIVDNHWVLMLPEGHALNRLSLIPLAALAKERFFLFPRRTNNIQHDAVVAACRRAGFQPIVGPELPHIFAAFPVVAAGLGISVAPSCLTGLHVAGVSFRRIKDGDLRVPLSLIHRRKDQSAAVKNLASLVRRLAEPGTQLEASAQMAHT